MVGYNLFILFFLQGSLFALSINEKSDNLSLDSKKNFNDTIQSIQKVVVNAGDDPVITIADKVVELKKIYNGNLAHLSIKYKEKVATASAHKITGELSFELGEEFIMLGENTLAAKKYTTKVIDQVAAAADNARKIDFIIIKQITSEKVKFSITTTWYKEAAKSNPAISLITEFEAAGPTVAKAPESPDFEISFTNTVNSAKPDELAFKKSENKYTAEFAVNVKVTAKKAIDAAVLEFILSDKMGDATVTYKLVKPANDDADCAASFPAAPPAIDLTGVNSKPYVGGSAYFLKCKYAAFLKDTAKEHKITGKVTTVGNSVLMNGTKLVIGLDVILADKSGNNPWAYALSSTSPFDSSSATGNSKKGLSKGAIAGIVIGVLVVVAIVIGLVIFLMKKK